MKEKKEKVVEPVKKAPVKVKLVTFERFFISSGRPLHHKAGMEAFTNTKIKRTMEAWELVFAEY